MSDIAILFHHSSNSNEALGGNTIITEIKVGHICVRLQQKQHTHTQTWIIYIHVHVYYYTVMSFTDRIFARYTYNYKKQQNTMYQYQLYCVLTVSATEMAFAPLGPTPW